MIIEFYEAVYPEQYDSFWLDECEDEPYWCEPEPEPDWPPVGVLSKGKVWLCCPKVLYNNQYLKIGQVLESLNLTECEELVDFLCGLDRLCGWHDCRFLNRDVFRREMALAALRQGDVEMARKHRDMMEKRSCLLDRKILNFRPKRRG